MLQKDDVTRPNFFFLYLSSTLMSISLFLKKEKEKEKKAQMSHNIVASKPVGACNVPTKTKKKKKPSFVKITLFMHENIDEKKFTNFFNIIVIFPKIKNKNHGLNHSCFCMDEI